MPKLTGSTRTIWIMALTAVISLAAGLGLSRMITSPADAAANAAPPEAGPITVPVEQRQLANDVVLRGDAIYEDPVAVALETGDLGGPAIVTGGVPEVGSTLDAGQVMLEVAGRPVILLAGDLPVYRTLRAGVSGPDVLQLKAALGALGINPGDAASDAYDAATAAAVVELYARVGYPAPTAGPDAQAALDMARDAVRSAEEQLTTARQAVDHPEGGSPLSARIRAQGAADVANIALQERRALCASTPPTDPDAAVERAAMCTKGELTGLEVALNSAVAERDEANAAPDTSAARAAVTSAQRALSDAQQDLADAQRDVLTPMPASEVVYLASTPRRVDSVEVKRGSTVAGTAVMNVSGATLQIAGSVSAADAELIATGSPVTIALPSGTEVPGTVESVGAPAAEGAQGAGNDPSRERVVVVPDALTDEQRAELQGANVRMTIPVSSTEGEVMAVPTAALTAGPGGEARVEVLTADGTSTLVTVETGLAAGGFVEVTPVDGTLEVGDRVVVGVSAGADDAEADQDEETKAPADESAEESTDEGSGEG
jgi:hypothetical protein